MATSRKPRKNNSDNRRFDRLMRARVEGFRIESWESQQIDGHPPIYTHNRDAKTLAYVGKHEFCWYVNCQVKFYKPGDDKVYTQECEFVFDTPMKLQHVIDSCVHSGMVDAEESVNLKHVFDRGWYIERLTQKRATILKWEAALAT